MQQRAHEELDRVIGRQAWPSAEDERQLPYIRAIIKEVQRLRPAFLVPAPHTSTEDFVYNGYYIPKGTCLAMNIHTLNRNEERYDNAWVLRLSSTQTITRLSLTVPCSIPTGI